MEAYPKTQPMLGGIAHVVVCCRLRSLPAVDCALARGTCQF